ncbi:MAG: hypothetical protein U9M94_00585 [Patescibacteria group bacterium]|nr:hypothetical protein [Patescibacteria group bacterium]
MQEQENNNQVDLLPELSLDEFHTTRLTPLPDLEIHATGDLFFSGVVFGSFALYQVFAAKLISNFYSCYSRHS